MSIIAFVPVRCGSKSIPMKNVKSFCGQPLVFWVLKALQESSRVDKVVLATDCDEIETVARDFRFSKVEIYRRKKENSSDTSSTESVILEYLKVGKYHSDGTFILCQATSPFTKSSDFDAAIAKYEKEKGDSLLTCCRLKRFIWSEKGESQNYDFRRRPRRQDFQGILVENGAFYINKVGNIIKSENRLTGRIIIYEMPEYTFTEIDEPEDWWLGESIMRKYVLQSKKDNRQVKMLLTDIDGVLTDAGMYYSEQGDELKKFCTYDGMAFKLLKERGIKVGMITAENRELNARRAEKLKVDYFYQGVADKLSVVKEICAKEGVDLNQVAYVGDDLNDKELLENVGFPACPENAQEIIKAIPNILHLSKKGGDGVIRDFYNYIFK